MPKNILDLFDTSKETLARYSHDMVYQGHPEYFYSASDTQTLQEILAYCDQNKIPVTFCGSQTAMTGSSVADNGALISLTNKNKILDIGKDKTGQAYVITEPGVILGDLKRAVQSEGFFYPPDPTSFNEAQIGASVATNATGEDTFKFGPTRWYVDELEILTSSGQKKTLKREKPLSQTMIKNTAGYFLGGEEIDEVIGSEGTLALITKLKLKLLDYQKHRYFLLILPFSRFDSCLDAVVKIAQSENKPRALELIGPGAGKYFQECDKCPQELKSENIFLYIKEDYSDDSDMNQKIETWFDFLSKLYKDLNEDSALERIFLAQTSEQLENIRECRHYIPLKVNETYFNYIDKGGGKVGTDWWVPHKSLREMMLWTHERAGELGVPFLVFAHIGNGHPHWNFLTRTPEEKKKAKDFVIEQCQKAVRHGGGVAGEHGIGKIKRDLIAIQHSAQTIQKMISIKRKWDPNWILGCGNLFAPQL